MTEVSQDIGTNPASPYIAGDNLDIEIACTSGDDPLDLTGAAIRWAAYPWPGRKSKQPPADAPVIVKGTAEGGVAVPSPASAGIFRVTLLPADTADLVGDHWHEAEVVDASGRVSTVATGRFLVTRQHLV